LFGVYECFDLAIFFLFCNLESATRNVSKTVDYGLLSCMNNLPVSQELI
jgi:hypothetical protein